MANGNTLTTADELDSPMRTKYLGVIDKMRELGINNDISLPQLVVVGDQSSGKSSLLEGITGLSFPVASDLCTRFATQLILRRCTAGEATSKVSIIPGPDADQATKEHLSKFKRGLDASDLQGQELTRILNEASLHMGLPATSTKEEHVDGGDTDLVMVPDKRFSDDVLKIELSGPDHRHLSVVDVPGLFHNPTPLQTAEDKSVIRNLIKQYISDHRTIIMAVMDATSNLASQEVFELARDVDPEGQRTVGVITKCDAVQEGDEESVLKIALNSVERLKHGWFGVKNRSTKDIKEGVTVAQRHQREKAFFSSAPWNQVSKERRGVGPLKTFLGNMLFDHIKLEFPSLVEDMGKLLTATSAELEELGASRGTPVEQRRYLTNLAMRYQAHVSASLQGRYDSSKNANPALKLRKNLRDLDDEFAEAMRLKGHTYVFKNVNDSLDSEYERDSEASDQGFESLFGQRRAPPVAEADSIYVWIKRTYLDSRGAELPGTINPAIMELLFHQQSAPWEEKASKYMSKCEKSLENYNQAVCELLIADRDARSWIQTLLKSHSANAVAATRAQLGVTVQDERGVLKTVNHYFGQTLRKCREDRILARLKSVSGGQNAQTHNHHFTSLAKIATLSNEDQAVHDIHDMLKAYYKVAMKRFTDNVTITVTERNLLGPNGPVAHFTPELVGSLSDDELAQIAGETFSTTMARNDCKEQVKRLDAALAMSREVGA